MHRLEIKNFGPINEANIEVGDLTVIIGEQATGKSTIAKLIYLFQSLKEDALNSALLALDSKEHPKGIFLREIQQKLSYFFKPVFFQQNTKIRYSYSDSNVLEVSRTEKGINISASTHNKHYWVQISESLEEISQLLGQQPNSKSILGDVNPPQLKIKNILDKIFPDCKDGLYFPAGRNISVGHSEQFEQYFRDRLILGLHSNYDLLQADDNRLPTADMFLLEKFMKRVVEIKDEFRATGGSFLSMVNERNGQTKVLTRYSKPHLEAINKRINLILRGEYRADGSAERIQFSKDRFIWLREASSGQQESIRIMQDMMLLTRTGSPVFRAIEEPEAHLFPLAQQYLVELIALAQVATDSRFVLTTHSPYIVSAINNILFYSQLSHKSTQNDLPKLNPDKLKGYMLTRDLDKGLINCESLIKEVGREGQPLKLMGHTSLDTVAEQMGTTFNDLRTYYRNEISKPVTN